MPDSGHEPTLRELAIRLADLDSRVQLQLKYHQEAIQHNTNELEHRMQWYNEFRDLLSQQISRLVTLDHLKEVDKRINSLELSRSNLEGRFWAVTAIVVLVELALVVWEVMVRR